MPPVRTLVLTGGTDPFVDPWHPFAETSRRIADIARSRGHEVEVSGDIAQRLADLGDVDLLIVNAPAPADAIDPDLLEAGERFLAAHLAAGRPVAGFHSGMTGLLGLGLWNRVIGARWIADVSGHPPLGDATIDVRDSPISEGPSSIDLFDEKYSFLEIDGPLTVVASHEYEGAVHPVVWLREWDGSRVFADALAHDARSFDSPEHVRIVERALDWLVEG
ncbi:ThuA domain-containing protein [Amnibacterium flavum]|uniref:ThuA domain-containing protein n=1 Tax=Amnibacterium flavum TaxID=2173173 RepID=UPI001403ECAE|nr:ThuA domain-containing protein [Amnibacterium flavum]